MEHDIAYRILDLIAAGCMVTICAAVAFTGFLQD